MAKNININLASIKDFFSGLVKNLRWVFFAMFLVMLILEIYQLKNSYFVIADINRAPAAAGSEKEVRINFDNYNQVVDRIQQAATFEPTGGITKNPFAAQVVSQPAQ